MAICDYDDIGDDFEYDHFIVSPRVVRCLSVLWAMFLMALTWLLVPATIVYVGWYIPSHEDTDDSDCVKILGGHCSGYFSFDRPEYTVWSTKTDLCPATMSCGFSKSDFEKSALILDIGFVTQELYLGMNFDVDAKANEALYLFCGSIYGIIPINFSWIVIMTFGSTVFTVLTNWVTTWPCFRRCKTKSPSTRTAEIDDQLQTLAGRDRGRRNEDDVDDVDDAPLCDRLFQQSATLGAISTAHLMASFGFAIHQLHEDWKLVPDSDKSTWHGYSMLGVLLFNGSVIKVFVNFGTVIVMQAAIASWKEVDARMSQNPCSCNPFYHMKVIFLCGVTFSWRCFRTLVSAMSHIARCNLRGGRRDNRRDHIAKSGLVFLAIGMLMTLPWWVTHVAVGFFYFYPAFLIILSFFLAVFFGVLYYFSWLTSLVRLEGFRDSMTPRYRDGCMAPGFSFIRNFVTLLGISVLGTYIWSMSVNLASFIYSHNASPYVHAALTEQFLRSSGCYKVGLYAEVTLFWTFILSGF